MLNLTTKADLKEASRIERRRRFEDERKQRIFNARQRIIGVDEAELQRQLLEKHKLEQEQVERERKFLEEQQRQLDVAAAKERELANERRRLHRELNNFRSHFQRPEDRREFDLYDPHGKQKDLPARLNDSDPRLSCSNAQLFAGEDLMSRERKRAQVEQQKAWLEQQIKERRRAEEERRHADKLHQEALEARERRAMELEQAMRAGRHRTLASVTQFNRSLAAEQEDRRRRQRREEEEDNLAEIYNHVSSHMLTEAEDHEKSNFGPHRIIPYSYRRMSETQVAELKAEQQRQLEEQHQKRQAEEEERRKWEAVTENLNRQLTLAERRADQMTRNIFHDTTETNLQLAKEQKRTRQVIDKIVYTNEPTPDYFSQFNTTSR